MQTASPTATATYRPRTLLLIAIAFNLLLIGGRAMLYSPLLSQPGGVTYLLEPVALLLVYALITIWVTAATTSDRDRALHYGSMMGVVTGVLWIINLALETFADLSALKLLATAPFLLGGFALWGVAGFRTAQRTGSIPSGVVAAIWSAITCVLMTIAFGLLLTFTALPHLENQLVADPDFLRSHWRDLRAFAIASSFDSAFSHLLGGRLIGTIVGAAGSWLSLLARHNSSASD
ncbi:MAG TPA: hypothetical protein VKX16_11300 [Chloroflexota bacterium]|nr:hypothetical protein [Chloroflexota bacterium]